MNYFLLTGSTGLLGRYLLRNLLVEDRPVAVVVRAGKKATALERVEAVMAHWENVEQRPLPRPVVFEGDLTQYGLGLTPQARQWVRENCHAVLHSAASMTFREDKRGEPFRTNIQGTQNLVEFCREVGLRQFHHVSTAYLCGLRTGRILETELDLGQPLGNVYEKSKLEAEKLIRAATHFDQTTFYRPASIVGDSRSGYVTSFHGFYLPLQLAYTFSNRIPPDQMNERFLAQLGLSGAEGKNFVPVDWVAALISYFVTHPEHHGGTYHAAAPSTVSATLFQRVVQDALVKFSTKPLPPPASAEELASLEQLFRDAMSIYRSHWRDDPQFDLTNTRRAAGHLPCPEIDYDLLMRVSRFPIENNFSAKKHEEIQLAFDSHQHLKRWLTAKQSSSGPSNSPTASRFISLQITGPGGGPWHLETSGASIAAAHPGLAESSADAIRLNTSTLAALAGGQLSVEQSLRSGRVVLQARQRSQAELQNILSQVIVSA